ncbi:MAG: isoaspartyl peptidase/L-asparaginase [Planctomycetota bacterium]
MSKSPLASMRILVAAACCVLALQHPVTAQENRTWAIALHGGAGSIARDIPKERISEYRVALNEALEAGTEVLKAGGSSLDAVQATVMKLEDNPLFNAGRGAVFDAGGRHQMDASIMDGHKLRGGGISMVTELKNPITAARLVMEKTDHVLLAGQEAETFAKQNGCETVDPRYFFTRRRWDQLVRKLKATDRPAPKQPAYGFPPGTDSETDHTPPAEIGDTVGCVALDINGHLAAATSTGGLTGKMLGRIGDSPILGAGSYADDRSVAVSGTGRGEEFIRHSIAARVGWLVADKGYSLDNAGKHCLTNVLSTGQGGLIAVDGQGNVFLGTNTGSMTRAWAKSDGTRGIGIWDEPLSND